jgi:hypothetical protein
VRMPCAEPRRGVGALPGILFSIGVLFISLPHLPMMAIVLMIAAPLTMALLGAALGWFVVGPAFFAPPLYVVKKSADGTALEPVQPDRWLDAEWPKYFDALNHAIVEEAQKQGKEEKAETLVDPVKSKMITARFDAIPNDSLYARPLSSCSRSPGDS